MEQIVGEKVILRPIELSDTQLIIKWRNSDFVKRNFIYREDLTVEAHTNWFVKCVSTGLVEQFIICVKENGRPIGSVYLRDIDRKNGSAEFGIFIGEKSEIGQGFGSECASLIVEYAFYKLDLHRVFLRVLQNNTHAINSYLRAGFSVEGIATDMVRIDNTYQNIVFMSIINQEK